MPLDAGFIFSSSPLLLAAAVAGSPFPLLAVAGEDTPC